MELNNLFWNNRKQLKKCTTKNYDPNKNDLKLPKNLHKPEKPGKCKKYIIGNIFN